MATTKPEYYVECRHIIDLSQYLFLEKQGIYASKKRFFHSHNNEQMHQALHQEKARMIILPEFWPLYHALKSGKAFDGTGQQLATAETNHLLNELAEKRSPWRAERIDAFFTQENGQWFYHTLREPTATGLVAKMREPLQPSLREDCFIDPTAYNRQGSPTQKSDSSEIKFWHPRNNSVAWFVANSDGVILDCSRHPGLSYSGLGVRKIYQIQDVKKKA